jgi:hypothetical protein
LSLSTITITKADTVTLSFQLFEDDVVKDITGFTFKFAVKEKVDDTAYKIDPVDGTIDDAANGKFSFDLTDVETDQDPFEGRYEISMFDGSGNKLTLSGARGVEFLLVEDIIDG